MDRYSLRVKLLLNFGGHNLILAYAVKDFGLGASDMVNQIFLIGPR